MTSQDHFAQGESFYDAFFFLICIKEFVKDFKGFGKEKIKVFLNVFLIVRNAPE